MTAKIETNTNENSTTPASQVGRLVITKKEDIWMKILKGNTQGD